MIDVLDDGQDMRLLVDRLLPNAKGDDEGALIALRAHLAHCHGEIVRHRTFSRWVRQTDPEAYWRAVERLHAAPLLPDDHNTEECA